MRQACDAPRENARAPAEYPLTALGQGAEVPPCPMADLFADPETAARRSEAEPLAARMRPRTLDEYAGQEHILGPGKLLRRAIEADRISSVLLFGPPGVGKTTLAQIIAHATESRFERLSGVESSVADMRRVIASASNRLQTTGSENDPLHRRDPPLQQGAAGCAAAGCGERRGAVDRRDHAQSVLLHQQPAGLALAGFPARAAHAGEPRRAHAPGPGGP